MTDGDAKQGLRTMEDSEGLGRPQRPSVEMKSEDR